MKKILLFVFATGFSMANFAQTTINGSDVNPNVGDSYTDNSANYMSPGNAGANQTWDLSTLTSSATMTTNVTASTTNGANMQIDNGTGNMVYENINSSAQEIMAIYSAGNNVMISYTNGEKVFQFPFTYNATYSDSFRATFTTNGYPAVRAGNGIGTVDGYGTLILPNQTITDVVRVNYQQDYYDTIDIGTPYIIHYTTNNYYWFRAGTHFVLATISDANYGGQTSQYAIYTNATNVGIATIEGVEGITILGNPVQSQLNFLVEANDSKEIEYSLVDLSGQVVYQTNTTTVLPGSNQLSINTDNLAKGMYALKISNGDAFISKLIVKE